MSQIESGEFLGSNLPLQSHSSSEDNGKESSNKDRPQWLQNLLEYFTFVKQEDRTIREKNKDIRRTFFTLTCNLCQSETAVANPSKRGKKRKVSKSRKVNSELELTGNAAYTFSRHLKRWHPGNHNPAVYSGTKSNSKPSRKRHFSDDEEDETITSMIIGGAEHAITATAGSSAGEKYAENGPKQKLFEELVLNLIVRAGMPLITVEKKDFKKLVAFFDNKLHCPSRRKLKRLLKGKCEKIKIHLEVRLKNLEQTSAHLLLDIWSSRQRLSVIGVQVRFIQDWKIHQHVIGFAEFPGSHDAQSIRRKVEAIVSLYGLTMKDFLTVTADNASAILNAFSDFTATICTKEKDGNRNQEEQLQPALTLVGDVDSEDDEIPDVRGEEREEITTSVITDDEISCAIDKVVSQWTATYNIVSTRRNSCLAHLLQLGVRDALSHNIVLSTMKKINAIITWFHKSNKQYTALRQETKLGFIKPCDTRWNSTCLCLQRMCTVINRQSDDKNLEEVSENEETLASIANKVMLTARKTYRKKIPACLSDEEIQRIPTIVSLLQPFLELTNIWQSDGVTSSSVILGVIDAMKALNSVIIADDDELFGFKQDLTDLILQRFCTQSGQKPTRTDQVNRRLVMTDIFNDKYYILSTVLDPRIKTVPFEEGFTDGITFRNGLPDKAAVMKILLEEFKLEAAKGDSEKILILNDNLSTNGSSDRTENKSEASNQSFSISKPARRSIFDSVSEHLASKSTKDLEANEVERYLSSPVISDRENPLKFWRLHQDLFPTLSKLASKYLSMPASSASVERLFSVAGCLISYKRCSMKIGTAEQIILYEEYLREGFN